MAYPTLDQYNEAFQAHATVLADPELKAGMLSTTSFGLPLAISGGFALTYTMQTARGKFAVRCFHREAPGIERRYAAISKRLAALGSPRFVDFEFQPRGIAVGGRACPIVKMAWAAGETLGQFLEAQRGSPAAIGRLASALGELAAMLAREGIAHGDLQPGNIMVARGGSDLRLIDYDGMYVDEIKDLGSAELGHVNFQHPGRKSANPFGPELDRFSLIAISLALKALAIDPSLWGKTNSEADALLFRANDFVDPGSSAVFSALWANPALAADAKNFAAVCAAPIGKAPSLAEFFAGQRIPPSSIALSAEPRPAARRAGYISPYPVVDATDFAACLRQVGDMVEVVGRVVEVREGKARNRKPYVFVNFGDWRGEIFKVAVWSEGLAAIKPKPGSALVGKWVSVVGLMEPPYDGRARSVSYRHLSISVSGPGQLSPIDEAQARWRLAGPKPIDSARPANAETLDRIKGRAPATAASGTWPTPAAAGASSGNKAILDKIHAAQPPRPSPPHPTLTPPATGGSSHPRASAQAASKPKGGPKTAGLLERLISWLFH